MFQVPIYNLLLTPIIIITPILQRRPSPHLLRRIQIPPIQMPNLTHHTRLRRPHNTTLHPQWPAVHLNQIRAVVW